MDCRTVIERGGHLVIVPEELVLHDGDPVEMARDENNVLLIDCEAPWRPTDVVNIMGQEDLFRESSEGSRVHNRLSARLIFSAPQYFRRYRILYRLEEELEYTGDTGIVTLGAYDRNATHFLHGLEDRSLYAFQVELYDDEDELLGTSGVYYFRIGGGELVMPSGTWPTATMLRWWWEAPDNPTICPDTGDIINCLPNKAPGTWGNGEFVAEAGGEGWQPWRRLPFGPAGLPIAQGENRWSYTTQAFLSSGGWTEHLWQVIRPPFIGVNDPLPSNWPFATTGTTWSSTFPAIRWWCYDYTIDQIHNPPSPSIKVWTYSSNLWGGTFGLTSNMPVTGEPIQMGEPILLYFMRWVPASGGIPAMYLWANSKLVTAVQSPPGFGTASAGHGGGFASRLQFLPPTRADMGGAGGGHISASMYATHVNGPLDPHVDELAGIHQYLMNKYQLPGEKHPFNSFVDIFQ